MLDTKFELRMVDVKIKCLIDEIDMDIDFSRNRLEMREKDLKEVLEIIYPDTIFCGYKRMEREIKIFF